MKPSKNLRAIRADKKNGHFECGLKEITRSDLSDGEVVVEVEYSGVNYKDALGCTGRAPIFKKLPITPGIDLAGRVISSESGDFKSGDLVLVNGCNIGEVYDGGYSEVARVRRESVIKIPPGLDPNSAMVLGTAGFTAALCLHRMEVNGQIPDMGPIAITGASGGVGCVATYLFSQAGYRVIAVSGKTGAAKEKLLSFGASEVVDPFQLALGSRPLEGVRFGGVVDNVGGELLSKMISHTELWGNVACVGLASGAELVTTVMPMILRGVSLLGISSNNCTMDLRRQLWEKLAREISSSFLNDLHTRTISLEEIPSFCEELLQRQFFGRCLVKVS